MIGASPAQANAIAPGAPSERIEVVVRRKSAEAAGINSYELCRPDGRTLPDCAAGAYIHVYLDNGITRQYSLCHPSKAPKSYVIAVNRERESRGGSAYIHRHWEPGDVVRISSPANHFGLVEGAPALLLAAGIGITPILAMAEELSALGVPFELHYTARQPGDAAFARFLKKTKYRDRVHLYFSRATDSCRMDIGQILLQFSADCHVYACGPTRFIKAVLDEAAARNLPSGRVHRELFLPLEGAIDPTDSFELHLAKSGTVVEVTPGGTILEAIKAAGVEVPTSCEVGVCGTCVTRVIEGMPDHRDLFLTDEEHARNDRFAPCCSWSKTSKLVVDL